MKIRVKGRIVNHETPDNTGMIHLCDSAGETEGETGRVRRLEMFPIGTLVYLEEAHLMGNVKIYRAYYNGSMDYFSEYEIELIEE